MGKIRTKLIGDEEVEKKQKKEAKVRAAHKKAEAAPEAEVAHVEEKTEEEVKPKTKKTKKSSSAISQSKTHGKKYQKARKSVDESKSFNLSEAVDQLKKLSYVKFDESVELHLNVLETGLKGEVSLPHSTGRSIRVAVIDDAILKQIEDGQIDFDILIAHPSYMPKIAKYARVLGPKGLMPNPKAGTVSTEPEKAAEKFQKGALRWKTEGKFPLIHQMIAKLSADTTHITENAQSFIKAVGKKNITEAYITATMTPSLRIDLETV